MPHLLGHGASVYNGHLRRPMTLTPIAERLAVDLSLPVLTVVAGIRTPSLPHPLSHVTLTVHVKQRNCSMAVSANFVKKICIHSPPFTLRQIKK